MNIQVKIGERIKKLREKKKLTQLQLAKKIKMDRTFITHVEQGRRNLSVQSGPDDCALWLFSNHVS